ncbi:MAG: hypothetical protein J5699_00235 [Bacteroidales bacterium]|nr:hypothetical protein [Bacteroidales bacterium]
MRKLKITKRIIGNVEPSPSKPFPDRAISWKEMLSCSLVLQLGYLDRLESREKERVRNRILAQSFMLSMCPEYYLVFEPEVRKLAMGYEIHNAKRELLKARYPKFYHELYEINSIGDDAEDDAEKEGLPHPPSSPLP